MCIFQHVDMSMLGGDGTQNGAMDETIKFDPRNVGRLIADQVS
jgi:hypothetical protein